MSCSFFGLPDDLLSSIVAEWLFLKDFGRLDSALCNRKVRVEVHRLLSTSRQAFAQSWIDCQKPNAQWLLLRGVTCKHVHWWGELLCDALLREEFLAHSGSMIETIEFAVYRNYSDEFKGVVQSSFRGILWGLSTYCPNLKETDIQMCRTTDSLSDIDLVALHTFISTHPTLQTVRLDGVRNIPSSLLQSGVFKVAHF